MSSPSGATLPCSRRSACTRAASRASSIDVSVRPACASRRMSPSSRAASGTHGSHAACRSSSISSGTACGERLDVAAVAVHEHDAVGPGARRPPELDEQGGERRRADRDRAREVLVLAARAVRDRRRDDGVDADRREPRGEGVADDGRHDGVGVERQVRPVLLGRAERHEHERSPAPRATAGPRDARAPRPVMPSPQTLPSATGIVSAAAPARLGLVRCSRSVLALRGARLAGRRAAAASGAGRPSSRRNPGGM